MKKYKTQVSFTKIALLIFMLFSTLVNAQTDLPDAPQDEPAAAPIDGYLLILAAVGFVFAILKLRALMSQENSQVK